jgi:hypothetical protein
VTQPPSGGGPGLPGTGGLEPSPPADGRARNVAPTAVGSDAQPQAPASADPSPAGTVPPLAGTVPPGHSSPQPPAHAQRYLLWRAKKSNKPILALWLTPTTEGCELSSDIYPVKSLRVEPEHAGPFKFRRAEDAQAFAQEAARALMHLGCEIVEDERSPQTPAPVAGGLRAASPPPSG